MSTEENETKNGECRYEYRYSGEDRYAYRNGPVKVAGDDRSEICVVIPVRTGTGYRATPVRTAPYRYYSVPGSADPVTTNFALRITCEEKSRKNGHSQTIAGNRLRNKTAQSNSISRSRSRLWSSLSSGLEMREKRHQEKL